MKRHSVASRKEDAHLTNHSMEQTELETRSPAAAAAAVPGAAELLHHSTRAAVSPRPSWFDRWLPRLLSPLHHWARRAMILTTHRSAAAKLAKRGEAGGEACLFCRLSLQARAEAGIISHAPLPAATVPAAPAPAAPAAAADDAKEPEAEAEEEQQQAGVVLQAPPVPETENEDGCADDCAVAADAASSPPPAATAASSAAASSCFLPAALVPDPPAASNRFLYSDALVYVISDAHPAARLHLLVLPHAHIRDCLTLAASPSAADRALLAHMASVGSLMLSRFSSAHESKRAGFHVPPYISQPHLHLHVLAGRFNGCCARRPGCERCCTHDHCAPPCDCLRVKYTSWCCWFQSMHEVQRKLDEAAAAAGDLETSAVPLNAAERPSPAQPDREKMEA